MHLDSVAAIDLTQTAEAAAGVVAIVGRPVFANGLFQQIVLADMQGGIAVDPSCCPISLGAIQVTMNTRVIAPTCRFISMGSLIT